MLHSWEVTVLSKSQLTVLVVFSAVLWVAATAYIRFYPAAFVDPVNGAISFVTALPMGWLSVYLTRRIAKLETGQLLPGIAVVGATAMMIDGLVLHFAPAAYGIDDTTIRFGAAWLLWGYGVSLGIALIMAAPRHCLESSADHR
jgi:uncharacterized membrane protein YoaK (UPF0700 family)